MIKRTGMVEGQERRGYYFAGAALLVLSVFVALLFASIGATRQAAQRANQIVSERREVSTQAAALLQAMVDAETGQRGYALTRDPSYLQPYNIGMSGAGLAVGKLRTIGARSPDLASQVEEVAARYKAALEPIQEAVRLLRADRAKQAAALLKSGAGQTSMDALRAAISELRAHAAARAADSLGQIAAARDRVNMLLFTLIFVFVGLVGMSGFFFIREHRLLLNFASQLNETNASLADARFKAEEADAAKTRFLAMASHDMRQPLHAMTLYLAALKRRVEGAQATDIVVRMEQAAASLTRMFSGLLDLARIESGVLTPNPVGFSLGQCFQTLARELAGDCERAKVSLRVVHTKAQVNTDPEMLESILRNLLTNAIKYASDGRVLLGCRKQGQGLRIEVVDEGPGIPQDKIVMLFGEFVRLDREDTTAREGLGLGLAIASRLAHLLGQDIQVASTIGKGTTFSVTVPLANAAAPPVAEPRKPPSVTVAGLEIAIADDDPLALAAMTRAFLDAGAAPSAFSGPSALAAALDKERRAFDLVIGGPGLLMEAFGEFSDRSRWPPAVIITGATDASTLATMQAWDWPILIKPVQETLLVETAARTARRRRRAVIAAR